MQIKNNLTTKIFRPILTQAVPCLLALGLSSGQSCGAETSRVDRIVMAAPLRDKLETHEYNVAVVRLALNKSERKYGKFLLNNSRRQYSAARALVALNEPDNLLNVHVTVTSIERENATIPIRIPIRFGILGYRLILINKRQKESFEVIQNVNQLLAKKTGVVSHWITSEVYRAKNSPIEEGYSIASIFKMLNAGRFDYLSRGVNEIYSDIKIHGHGLDQLMLEPNLAVYLPMPYYIFVRKSQPELAARIELGLEKGLEDGSLRKLFMRHHQEVIRMAALEKRTILYLENPILPPNTPTHRKELWYFHDKKFGEKIFGI